MGINNKSMDISHLVEEKSEMSVKEKCDKLLKILIDKTCESCSGCDFHNYSTTIDSWRKVSCKNTKSSSHGFMDGSYGCPYHSEADKLRKEYEDIY